MPTGGCSPSMRCERLGVKVEGFGCPMEYLESLAKA